MSFFISLFRNDKTINLLSFATLFINFEEVYLVTPVVIFLCTNFRYLRDSVSNVIFLLGGTYVFFGLITYLFLSSESKVLSDNLIGTISCSNFLDFYSHE